MEKKNLLIGSFFFFIFAWGYRLFNLHAIIQHGILADFSLYYKAAKTIIIGQPNNLLIAKTTFGPPFVLLPYLPFAFFSLKTAEYLVTIIAIICYFSVFYLFWKKRYGKPN